MDYTQCSKCLECSKELHGTKYGIVCKSCFKKMNDGCELECENCDKKMGLKNLTRDKKLNMWICDSCGLELYGPVLDHGIFNQQQKTFYCSACNESESKIFHFVENCLILCDGCNQNRKKIEILLNYNSFLI